MDTKSFDFSEQFMRGLQERNVLALARNGAFKFTDSFFIYTSGQVGPYFVQSIDIEKTGADYRFAVDSLAHLVRKEYFGRDMPDVVSGGESRDWDFSNPVAVALRLAHAKLYKDSGKNPALGAVLDGKRVIHVADLQNEGSSVRDSWYPQVANAGGIFERAFFFVDRLEDGVKVMSDLGVPSHAVVPLDGFSWGCLLKAGHITQSQYESLNLRLDDKTAWASAMLKSNPDVLIQYLKDPKSRAKAEKVLTVGYPEIRGELEQRMGERGYVHVWGEQK